MGIQDLFSLIESEGVPVDLFKISRNQAGGLQLILDAEGCLDRLYGGYFSDWACGGQWARCVQFVTTLAAAMSEHQVSLCVCFNGAHPTSTATPHQWVQLQANNRQKVNMVLRHIATKGTPPPKVWWVPPTGLQSCLRNILRYLNINIMVSSDDHLLEVVSLCREKSYAGIIGSSAQYLIFQPPRLFCSVQLKLTYRSSLETKEYMVENLPALLDVPSDRLSLAAALFGDSRLSEQSLSDFYKRLNSNYKKATPEAMIKSICQFVKDLPSSDINNACVEIFGDMNDLRAAKLKEVVQYYESGRKEAFVTQMANNAAGRRNKNKQKPAKVENQSEAILDTSKLATESAEQEQKGLEDYRLATANAKCVKADFSLECPTRDLIYELGAFALRPDELQQMTTNVTTETADRKFDEKVRPQAVREPASGSAVPAEVLRTCSERHARGLMHPQVRSILVHRTVLLPTAMEDDGHREVPSVHHFLRPIRQNVYAVLFNMHHQRYMAAKAKEEGLPSPTEPCPPVQVAEWIYTRMNPGKSPEMTPGVMLDWPVPTVQRLWFGNAQEDKCRRMRAFLSCMRSDTPLMLNTTYVPQQLLILATVLRYIMTAQVQVLRRQELDAVLATAFSNDLMNSVYLQELSLTGVTSRGVQLGALIMSGVEAALLANDACGAPVPWLATGAWLALDGKLLHHKLARAVHAKHLAQLCDSNLEVVVKVERMRKAILEGLEVEFAMPPLGMGGGVLGLGAGGVGMNPGGVGMNPGGGGGSTWGRGGRGRGAARLEIAGVVVGQWGSGSYRHHQMNYVSYTPCPRNAYGARGRGARGARGGARGGRGGRRREHEPARHATIALNGKTVRSDEVLQCEEASPASSPNDNEGNGNLKTGGRNKNGKKSMNKGKKKSSGPKLEAQTVEPNGPLEKPTNE